MRFHLEISQTDFERASWLAMRKGPLPRALRFYFRIGFITLWVTMCMLPFAQHPSNGTLFEGLAGSSFGVGILGIQLYLMKVGFCREYRRSVWLRLPGTVDLDENGLHWSTAESDSRSSWRNFLKYSEDGRSFLLFHRGSLSFVPIPKRMLSAREIADLKVVLSAHLPLK